MEKFELFQGRSRVCCYKWHSVTPKGCICLLHGLGEHGQRYDTTARFFTEMGFHVYALDFLGHGYSDGGRGNIGPRMAVLYTIDKLVAYAQKESKGLPVFLMGHSLGGNLALAYRLFMPHSGVRAYVLSAPWLVLSSAPSVGRIFLSKCLSMVVPSQKLNYRKALNKEDLTDVASDYLQDELIHPFISVQTFSIAHKNAIAILASAGRIEGPPAFFFHGTADHVCSIEGSRSFCQKAENASLFALEGAGHETMHRREYFEVLERVCYFLYDFLGDGSPHMK